MAQTTISDLWTPAVWAQGIPERMATFPRLFNSGAVVNSPFYGAKASGEGTSINIGFILDPSDGVDEIQVENTAPTLGEVTGATINVPILNRAAGFSATALAKQVSGSDPVGAIWNTMAERRLKQRQSTVLSILRGAFGTLNATTRALTAALAGVRLDRFDESGADATSDQLMGYNLFIDGCAMLGELEDDLVGGALWMHPIVRAGLKRADQTNFDKASQGAFTIETYRGIPIFVSEALRTAGGESGYVYDSYMLARGVIGYGEKPQASDTVDAATLNLEIDKGKNAWNIYDYTRLLVGLNGIGWTPAGGTPAGQSATNTELATITSATANWTLKSSSASRCGAACILTNG